jgi:NhaA family Na+:H+ antiporter
VRRALRFVADHYLLVPIGAAIAIVWANTAAPSYFRVAETLAFAVNDVGMAFLLAFAGQEVVEATMPGGTLHPWRRALLPVVAAIGGCIGAVGTYGAFILIGDTHNLLGGWPIVTAVDIALPYALAAAIFGAGAARTFVLLLALASDTIGLALVAGRYPVPSAHPAAGLLMIPAVWVAVSLRRRRVRTMWAQVAVSGTLSWLALYWSGVHPALALLPIVPLLPHSPRPLDPLADSARGRHKAAAHFEYVFRYPVQAIAFLFGLVNAGVMVRGFGNGTWAVVTAALAGRPAGILAGVTLGGLAGLHLPPRVHWRDVVVIALCAAPGFTFGLFFATAVFPIGPLLTEVKIGAMATVAGALLALIAARVLRVGRNAQTAMVH